MADKEWIKNLASAKFINGQWENTNPQSVSQLAEVRIEDSVAQLYEEASEAADLYNLHAVDRPSISILSIAKEKSRGNGGVIMLLGKTQLNIEIYNNTLEAQLTTVDGFHRNTTILAKLTAQADSFGSVMWLADKSSLMSNELIVKKLMEQLVRSAFQAGEIQ